jgi:hypothetical protein
MYVALSIFSAGLLSLAPSVKERGLDMTMRLHRRLHVDLRRTASSVCRRSH